MKVCIHCKILKPIHAYRTCRLYKNMTQGEYVRSECKDCEKKASRQLSLAKKQAPPKPTFCDCCNQPTTHLVLDHDHTTGLFRGWLCRNCNQGIGKLGDNIEGLMNAIDYLQKSNN